MASLYYQAGDRVRIIGNHRTGCIGEIIYYNETDGALVQIDGETGKKTCFAPYEITPYNGLRVGDYVEVLKGVRQGDGAFVKSMDNYGVIVEFSDGKTAHYGVMSLKPINTIRPEVDSGIASTVSEASPLPTGSALITIDMTKEYISVDGGYSVRIICIDRKGLYDDPVVFLLTNSVGDEIVGLCDTCGRNHKNVQVLMEKPKKVKYLKSVPELMAEGFTFDVCGNLVSKNKLITILACDLCLLGTRLDKWPNCSVHDKESLKKEV